MMEIYIKIARLKISELMYWQCVAIAKTLVRKTILCSAQCSVLYVIPGSFDSGYTIAIYIICIIIAFVLVYES